MTKRIFISADHGMAIIYFLQSDVVPTLLNAGVEIIVLTDDETKDKIAQRFSQPGLSFEGLRLKQANDYARKVSPRWQWLLAYLRRVGGSRLRVAGQGGTAGGHILVLSIVPERSFAISILTNAQNGWRLIQDVEREALRSYHGIVYAKNQAIAHRGLVETLPVVQPLASQPDPAPYLGTYLRPGNSVDVRVEGGRLVVQERPNNGQPRRAMPVAFYGPDRVVVTDGPERGQSIEFVRDTTGRVSWIRVVGRVAVRTP